MTLSAHVRRVAAASLLTIALAGAAAAFGLGFTGAIHHSLTQTAAATDDRLTNLAQTLIWTQASSVGLLWLLSVGLFALAWFLRERLIGPLETLRHSVATAAEGSTSEPLWGISRKDEIGAIARAADKLRQAADGQIVQTLHRRHLEVMERLTSGALRLEADLSRISAAAGHARLRIEHAGLRAAKASHAAIEAAELARAGAARITEQTQDRLESSRRQSRTALDTLVATVARLSDAAARLEGISGETAAASHPLRAEPGDIDAIAVLGTLADGLEALESFVRHRPALAHDQLLRVTSALLHAVERLTQVADALSGESDSCASA